MIKTECTINGKIYPLKYQKIFSKDGEAFQGIVFLKTAIGFLYVRRTDNSLLFEPSFFDRQVQRSIITAIEENEQTLS